MLYLRIHPDWIKIQLNATHFALRRSSTPPSDVSSARKSERQSTQTENLEGEISLPLPSSSSSVNPRVYSWDDTDMLLARSGVRFRAHAPPVLPTRVLARTCHATALRRHANDAGRRRGVVTERARESAESRKRAILFANSLAILLTWYFVKI